MNQTYRAVTLLGMVLHTLFNLHAQDPYSRQFDHIAARCTEELLVFTDRSVYAVNEPIRFSARLRVHPYPYNPPRSHVLYVELVGPSGEAVARGKYPVRENRSSGQLMVPGSALSGNHYLRAYTRWMRNFGPGHFTYLPVKVLNPFSNRIETASGEISGRELVPDTLQAEPMQIRMAGELFGNGDSVRITAATDGSGLQEIITGCITAVPWGTIDSMAYQYHVTPFASGGKGFRFTHLPDVDGMVISGRVTGKGSGDPIPGLWIHFSMPGSDPCFVVAKSENTGRFAVRLPEREGIREMIAVPEPLEGIEPDILIDNDFSPEPLPFDPAPFSLSEWEREAGSRIALNMQLGRAFYTEHRDATTIPEDESIPFYGIAPTSIQLEEFIDLPNLEEVIENLVPGVSVSRSGETPAIRISGNNTMTSLYRPLILVDRVPVFDMDQVLSLAPSQIARIEVVPEVYLLGEAKFGGLFIITSTKGNMAGMTLSGQAYFFDFMNFTGPGQEAPEKNPGARANPDVRNTFFWDDEAVLIPGRHFQAAFRVPGNPGRVLVLYRGLTSSGKKVQGSCAVVVE